MGEDQKQHLELARDIAQKFNNDFGAGEEVFTLPEPIIPAEAARIMSLRDGSAKMSKSDPSDMSRINLTDDADSVMILRSDKDDPSTEVRIPLPAGQQIVIDTQRFYHAVWHPGDKVRYCLITSWESGPELQTWMDARHPVSSIPNHPIDPAVQAEGEKLAADKRAARAAALAAEGKDPRFGDGSMALAESETMEVLSEA